MTGEASDGLAGIFEENRTHLRAIAYRMLGSPTEADDAVQDAWLRLSRTDAGAIENLRGWLTTVVARVCLDILRSRKSRREESLDSHASALPDRSGAINPEHDAILAESVGLAMLVVLDALAPAERVAFVLHDMFDVPFETIASILDRSPDATRQLASRARRRVQGAPAPSPPDHSRQAEIVAAFLAASRAGDFASLLALLDPEAVVLADPAAVLMGAAREARGATAVAETFAGRARGAQPALVDGLPGLVWSAGGQARVAFAFTIRNGAITSIELIADPDRLEQFAR